MGEAGPSGDAKPADARTLSAAADVLEGSSRKGFFARLAPFLGPAFACRRILVPLDGAPVHENGLCVAAGLARPLSAAPAPRGG